MKDPTEPLLVNQRWVAEKGGIPVSTQEDLRRKGLFAPWLRIGNRIYYRRAQLEQWITEQEAKATVRGEPAGPVPVLLASRPPGQNCGRGSADVCP